MSMYHSKVGTNKKGRRTEIIHHTNNVDHNEHEERKESEWKKKGESEVLAEVNASALGMTPVILSIL